MEMPLKRAKSFLVISLLLLLLPSFSFAQRWCYALLEQLSSYPLRRKVQLCISLLLVLFVAGLVLSQSPYPNLAPGQEVFAEGKFLIERGSKGTMNITADDLEQLTYGLDEIPGWIVFPPPREIISKTLGRDVQGVHTIIRLDEAGYVGLKPVPGGMRSQILRLWHNLEQVVEYQKGRRDFNRIDTVDIDIRVYDRPAVEHGETLSEYRWQSQSGIRMKAGTPSGFPLGEESWHLAPTTVFFRLNRCAVLVHAPDLAFAEALAVGIEYRIQQHPKRLGMAQRPLTVLISNQPVAQGKAISLGGVAVAPVSALKPAQVSIKTNRSEKEWTVTASRNGKWVKVKAFSWEMETEKGKVKLDRPVFPYKGELIVPLRQVAEALGIVVQQKGQTIALLPK